MLGDVAFHFFFKSQQPELRFVVFNACNESLNVIANRLGSRSPGCDTSAIQTLFRWNTPECIGTGPFIACPSVASLCSASKKNFSNLYVTSRPPAPIT